MGKGNDLTGRKKPKPPSASTIRYLWQQGDDAEIRRLREEYHGKLEAWRRDQDIEAAQTRRYKEALDRVIDDLKSGAPATYSYKKVEIGQGMSVLGQVNEVIGDVENMDGPLGTIMEAVENSRDAAAAIHQEQDFSLAESAAQKLNAASESLDDAKGKIASAKADLESLSTSLAQA